MAGESIYIDLDDSNLESELFSTETLRETRQKILDHECVEHLYPRINASTKVVRALSAATSSIRSTIADVLNSNPEKDDPGDSSLDDLPDAHDTARQVEEQQIESPDEEVATIYIRLGTTPGSNVPETARQVARVVRRKLGENVEVHVDIVNV